MKGDILTTYKPVISIGNKKEKFLSKRELFGIGEIARKNGNTTEDEIIVMIRESLNNNEW